MSVLSSEIARLKREKGKLSGLGMRQNCMKQHQPSYTASPMLHTGLDKIINTNLISFRPSASMTCRICFGVIGASE